MTIVAIVIVTFIVLLAVHEIRKTIQIRRRNKAIAAIVAELQKNKEEVTVQDIAEELSKRGIPFDIERDSGA